MVCRPQHSSKPFFAFARGVFPVHELCGAFTAMALVRKDILGENLPWWAVLGPAVVLHGMANFRVSVGSIGGGLYPEGRGHITWNGVHPKWGGACSGSARGF
jgi:hypothetical protein